MRLTGLKEPLQRAAVTELRPLSCGLHLLSMDTGLQLLCSELLVPV